MSGAPERLRITEIFRSIQGESTHAGFPCAFVRLTGCALRCAWCDSAYAFTGGAEMSVDEAAERVLGLDTRLVEVTGGEPLEQDAVYPLMDRLLGAGRTVLLETGGHVPLDRVDPRVVKIVDVKAPGSGMRAANRLENLDRLLRPRRAQVRARRPRGFRLVARLRRRPPPRLPTHRHLFARLGDASCRGAGRLDPGQRTQYPTRTSIAQDCSGETCRADENQKAEGSRQKAVRDGRLGCLLLSAFCLLVSAFCLLGPMSPKAIVLLSGGLDSATCLLMALAEGFEVHALSFDYGQRHAVELDRARALARFYGVAQHCVVRVDLPSRNASALTNPATPVPRNAVGREAIPITYVPARNTLFLSHAVAWGEAIGAGVLYIGANALDYSGYPDCRPEFLEAFERAANLGTKAGVEGTLRFSIRAPLLSMTKAEIVRKASELGLEFLLTSSCYDPSRDGAACGACDACLLREKGFREAGLPTLSGMSGDKSFNFNELKH